MKDLSNNPDDKNLAALFKIKPDYKDVPEELKNRILENIREKEIEIKNEKVRPGKKKTAKRNLKFLFAAAVFFVCILAIVLYAIILNPGSVDTNPVIVYTTGETIIKRGKENFHAVAGKRIKKGDNISSKDKSHCALYFRENIIINVFEDTDIAFPEIQNRLSVMEIQKGKITLADNTVKKGSLIIKTSRAEITPAGTYFFVEHNEYQTVVSVYGGKVRIIRRSDRNDRKILYADQTAEITSSSIKISGPVSERIRHFSESGIPLISLKNNERTGTVTFRTGMKDVHLQFQNRNFLFDDETSFLLRPDEYSFLFQKQGFLPSRITVTVKPGMQTEKDILLIPDKPDINQKIWRSEKVFIYKNKDNPSNNKILGYGISAQYALAVTQTDLIGMTGKGKILFKKSYGEKKRIMFDAMPCLLDTDAYIPANYAIIKLNMRNGADTVIETTMILSHGFSIIADKNSLFIPYPEGLYTFDYRTDILNYTPVIPFENSVMPLFMKDRIYMASSVSPSIMAYSDKGRLEYSGKVNFPFLRGPVSCGDFIAAGDKEGWVYLLSESLIIKDKIKLDGGIYSLSVTGGYIYAFTATGTLYSINVKNFKTISKITVDTEPEPGIYNYKSPVFHENRILIGTGIGELLFIEPETLHIEKTVKLSDSPVSCSVYPHNKSLFTGTQDGEIIRLHEEVE